MVGQNLENEDQSIFGISGLLYRKREWFKNPLSTMARYCNNYQNSRQILFSYAHHTWLIYIQTFVTKSTYGRDLYHTLQSLVHWSVNIVLSFFLPPQILEELSLRCLFYLVIFLMAFKLQLGHTYFRPFFTVFHYITFS